MPKGHDLETVYTVAVSAASRRANDARRFVLTLAGRLTQEMRRDAGFGGYVIRPAVHADHDPIRGLVQAVLAEYSLAPDPQAADRDLADIDGQYFARRGLFDVAVAADGRIAGCCGVYAVDDQTCELRKMYLLPEARRKGLGGRLLRRAIAFARGMGYRVVELETAAVLQDAIRLYTSAGFKPIDRAALSCRCDQAYALIL